MTSTRWVFRECHTAMLDAPRQDWSSYEERRLEAHREWLQSLTPESGLALYEDLCSFAASLPAAPEELARLERNRRQEKLEVRRSFVAAFNALDRVRSEGRHSQDPG